MKQLAYRGLFLLTLAAILYLDLRPDSRAATTPLFPAWLGAWFDHHDTARNFIGFAVLTLASLIAFGSPAPHPSAQPANDQPAVAPSGDRRQLLLLAALVALVVLLELAQRWIPARTADPKDVLAGGVGIGFAWLLWRGKAKSKKQK